MEVDAATIERLGSILQPFAWEQMGRVVASNTRFVHYTSADAAVSILRNANVWMRNAVVMNDFREVQHGFECLDAAYADEAIGGRFKAVLNRLREGITGQIEATFRERLRPLAAETYLFSFSEHDATEDMLGRLSMWRAYGGSTPIAFVFNNHPFVTPSDALGAYTSPVLYADRGTFRAEFEKATSLMEHNVEFLQTLEPELVVEAILTMFQSAIVSTKHPGFGEEREWRVIYSPMLQASNKLVSDCPTIDGVPQRIYKIPMVNFPEEGFTGATIPEVINRVIVGPTKYPWPVASAIMELLANAGVENAHDRVIVSEIPLRR